MECCTKITFGKIKYFKIKFSEHVIGVTCEFINMTRVWDKEKNSESPAGIEPMFLLFTCLTNQLHCLDARHHKQHMITLKIQHLKSE